MSDLTNEEIQARARAREAELREETEKRIAASVLAIVTKIVYVAGSAQRCCDECGCLLLRTEHTCFNCAMIRAKRRGRG